MKLDRLTFDSEYRRGVTQHYEADYLFQDDLRRIAELAEGRALLEAAGLATGAA